MFVTYINVEWAWSYHMPRIVSKQTNTHSGGHCARKMQSEPRTRNAPDWKSTMGVGMTENAARPSLLPITLGAIVTQIQSTRFADAKEEITAAPPSTIRERIPNRSFNSSKTWQRSSDFVSKLRRQGRIVANGNNSETWDDSAASSLQQSITFRAFMGPGRFLRCCKVVSKTTGLGCASPHNRLDNLGLSVDKV